MPYDALLAETIRIRGHGDDQIAAYVARPLGPGPFPSVVVIHHMPGWDDATKEITRKFASRGYLAICPHLHYREGPDAAPTDAAAAVRADGGVPDERCIGDVRAAAAHLLAQTSANGKVGVIGYCSGGRQSWAVACNLPLDAAIVCYGGGVVATPEQITPRTPISPLDMTPNMQCPVLGLFGATDAHPSPEQVARMDAELTRFDKPHEFHTFPGAGHAFFSVDRPSYRVQAANEGWELVWDFFGRYLSAG